jgi:hypothetical protein
MKKWPNERGISLAGARKRGSNSFGDWGARSVDAMQI